ncbi:MAG TPA: tetratricopeptide repeat protein [Streptosporangiaceae bacterium]
MGQDSADTALTQPHGAGVQLALMLRGLRRARGLSQRAVARPLHLGSHSTITDYEAGRRIPPPDVIAAYERFFALPHGELARWRAAAIAERAAAGDRLAAPVPARHVENLPSAHHRLPGASADAGAVVPAAAAGPQLRYSLPADTAAFTGRSWELDRITAAVRDAAGAGGVVAVGAVNGMPGVGKTALAVHAAHLLTAEFPDRQLFIDLHGHTPGREPVRPDDALAGLLAAVGLNPTQLPGDLSGRAAMWRDRMAGQQSLLVLDNAASSGQVIPLLPGSQGCLVLVTSRRHLGDLPGAVTPVPVDVLAPGEAADMFSRLAPHARDDRDGVAEVVALAGYLPLAVALLARVFARHPSWRLADLAAETKAGLLTMAAEHDCVAAAFEVSYRYLDPSQQRLFRLLGGYPGATIDRYGAAALAGTAHDEAAGLLDGLHREGLLTEAGYRRYGLHDLLRQYARERAADELADFQQGLDRLMDYYQYTAAVAGSRIGRQTRPGPVLTAPASGSPDLQDAGQALAWVRAERASLLGCLDLAADTGQLGRVVALTAGVAAVLQRDGPWSEAITRHAAAVEAARHLGDRLGEANALNDLGVVQQMTGDPGAAEVLARAASIYRDLGSRLGEANALHNFAIAQRTIADFPGIARTLKHALGIYRDLGDRPGEATALNYLGELQQMMGDYSGAAESLEQALSIYRDLGNPAGQAHVLTDLGVVWQVLGDYRGAATTFQQALSIFRDIGNRLGEANALRHLGEVRQVTGDSPAAAAILAEALAIYRSVGDRRGEANVLTNLGAGLRMTGDYSGAAGFLEDGLRIHRDLGGREGQAEALNEQAALHQARGDRAQAELAHREALDLARAIGSILEEARALAGLGRCAKAGGRITEAHALLRQAHKIFERVGAAETHEVLADTLTAQPRDRRATTSSG